MYVEKIEIENIRCFKRTVFEPCHPKKRNLPKDIEFKNVSLLLGNNGAGKSTTLRCLAIGVLSRVLEVSEYQPDHMVRRSALNDKSVAYIRTKVMLGPNDAKPKNFRRSEIELVTSITREGDYERVGKQKGPYIPDLFVDLSPTFFMVGYGATRRMEARSRSSPESKDSRLRFGRVASLFNDFVALTPLNSWLPHLKSVDKKRFQEIVKLINELLPPEIRFTGEQEKQTVHRQVSNATSGFNRDYVFKMDKQDLAFRALSDGYRAYIAWIVDLVYHLYQCTPKKTNLKSLTGLVLVDEIDLHLHPSWQREVIGRISNGLPHLQFVCTTHSPIVAGTLRREQVYVMDRNSEGEVVIDQFDERIHGMNADQILTSSYFGLTTTRAPDFIDELRKIRQRAWAGDEKATLEYLQAMSGDQKTSQHKTSKSVGKAKIKSTKVKKAVASDHVKRAASKKKATKAVSKKAAR